MGHNVVQHRRPAENEVFPNNLVLRVPAKRMHELKDFDLRKTGNIHIQLYLHNGVTYQLWRVQKFWKCVVLDPWFQDQSFIHFDPSACVAECITVLILCFLGATWYI